MELNFFSSVSFPSSVLPMSICAKMVVKNNIKGPHMVFKTKNCLWTATYFCGCRSKYYPGLVLLSFCDLKTELTWAIQVRPSSSSASFPHLLFLMYICARIQHCKMATLVWLWMMYTWSCALHKKTSQWTLILINIFLCVCGLSHLHAYLSDLETNIYIGKELWGKQA